MCGLYVYVHVHVHVLQWLHFFKPFTLQGISKLLCY